jgi:hypothetical protein
MQRCFKCQKEIKLPDPMTQEAVCPNCATPLHCCFNCRSYSPGAFQQCLVADLPLRRDKRSANDCPSFTYRTFHDQRKDSIQESSLRKLDDLFKNL